VGPHTHHSCAAHCCWGNFSLKIIAVYKQFYESGSSMVSGGKAASQNLQSANKAATAAHEPA